MLSDRPLVSILIPCYNAEPWLKATLSSALAQTGIEKEIILVDDGSTDQSLAIARSFRNPELKIVSQENRGQSASFNRAIREAQGDFFEYLDADDLLHPEKIARQLAALRAQPVDSVASGAWARFHDDPESARFQSEAIWTDMDPVTWLATSWAGGGMMHGAAWLVPRGVAERAGPWSEDLNLVNDFDYFSRILLQSTGVKFCRDALSYYRSGLPGSLSSTKSRNAWESAYRSFTRGTQALLARENSPRTRKAAAHTFQSFAYAAYPTAPDLVREAERRVAELGGSDLELGGGRVFRFLSRALNWKIARRAQRLWHSRR
jgi:glycosyltransferase involved in cell wall biosynthesis